MGIIEEIEKWVANQVAAPEWIRRNERIADGVDLMRRTMARLRELEEALTKLEERCGLVWTDGPIPTTPELLVRIEALEAWRAQPTPPIPLVGGMLQRIAALEAREDARGRLEAEAVPPGAVPAPSRRACGAFCDPDEGYHTEGCRYRYVPMWKEPAPVSAQPALAASKCAGCGCFIRVEGAHCGVCSGREPNLVVVIQPLRQIDPEPPLSYGHCPHTPCCHCRPHSTGCPGDASPTAVGQREFRRELDTDQAFFCEHANECPSVCPCPKTCYCQQPGRTCRTRVEAQQAGILADMRYESRGS